jgi:hypothetical protein
MNNKTMNKSIRSAPLIFLIFAACSSAPQTTVVPKETGDYFVISSSKDESKALQSAVDQGNKYCETKGKQFVVSEPAEPQQRNTSQTEELNKAADTVENVLGRVMGNKAKLQQMKNQAYTRDGDQLVMNFKCH